MQYARPENKVIALAGVLERCDWGEEFLKPQLCHISFTAISSSLQRAQEHPVEAGEVRVS